MCYPVVFHSHRDCRTPVILRTGEKNVYHCCDDLNQQRYRAVVRVESGTDCLVAEDGCWVIVGWFNAMTTFVSRFRFLAMEMCASISFLSSTISKKNTACVFETTLEDRGWEGGSVLCQIRIIGIDAFVKAQIDQRCSLQQLETCFAQVIEKESAWSRMNRHDWLECV